MAYETILLETDGGVATLTINQPRTMNALNSSVLVELGAAISEIAANEEIKAVVVTGAGGKAFVAGADISELSQCDALGARKLSKLGHEVIGSLQALPIPVIAAVNGYALGGGCELALACDFIYASETAKFGLPEITLGLIPGFGGTQRLQRIVGKNMAKELIFTGKMLSAEEAKEIGLVNRVISKDDLMVQALETAKSIAGKGKVSLRAAKVAVNNGADVDLSTGCDLEIDAFALCFASEDAREGTSAFLEKRKAEFKGGRNG